MVWACRAGFRVRTLLFGHCSAEFATARGAKRFQGVRRTRARNQSSKFLVRLRQAFTSQSVIHDLGDGAVLSAGGRQRQHRAQHQAAIQQHDEVGRQCLRVRAKHSAPCASSQPEPRSRLTIQAERREPRPCAGAFLCVALPHAEFRLITVSGRSRWHTFFSSFRDGAPITGFFSSERACALPA